MDDLDILTLAEAAGRLGVAQVTLRSAAARGVLHARLVGKTWVTTGDEVERYRQQNQGRVGRPRLWRRASRTSGWVATYRLLDGIADHAGRRIDAQGAVAMAIDSSANDAEILLRLNLELGAQGLAAQRLTVDPAAKTLEFAVRDRREPNMLETHPPFDDVLGQPGALNILRDQAK